MAAEKQKKHRFNIIDFVLLIAVLACVVGIALRYNLNETINRTTDTAEVDIIIERLLNTSADALHVGDTLYTPNNDAVFGEILSIETKPAVIRYSNNDGTITYTTYEDRVDVTLRIHIEGYNTENGFMIGGVTYIGNGSTFPLASPYIETQCTVLNVMPNS